jgi:hypothetical protein
MTTQEHVPFSLDAEDQLNQVPVARNTLNITSEAGNHSLVHEDSNTSTPEQLPFLQKSSLHQGRL